MRSMLMWLTRQKLNSRVVALLTWRILYTAWCIHVESHRPSMIPKSRQPLPVHSARYLLRGCVTQRAVPLQTNRQRNFVINSRTSSVRQYPAFQSTSTPLPRTFSTFRMSQDNGFGIVLPHEEVESLWFGGLNLSPGAAPSMEALVKRWFLHDDKFDLTCRCKSPISHRSS